jgi:hypothetical protein
MGCVGEKGKSLGEGRDALFPRKKSIDLLDGSQASPAHPSDKGSMKVKTSD